MASMLPLGEKTAAFVNREEITACFCYWMEEAVSIHLHLAHKIFSENI